MIDIKQAKELYESALKHVKGECGEISENTMQLAFNNCKASSDMGYMPAINLLGIFYAIGYGTTVNEQIAKTYFEKCIAERFDVSVFNLGVLNNKKINLGGFSGKMEILEYFRKGIHQVKSNKMQQLMIDVRRHIAGEIYATESNIGYILFLRRTLDSLCFLDVDDTIKWIDYSGYINEQTSKIFEGILNMN